MYRVVYQGWILLLLFFLTLFLLNRIDWMRIMRIEKMSQVTEEKIGDLFWGVYSKSERIESDEFVGEVVDSILTKICRSNGIDRGSIKIHIVRRGEVNAFAMPGRRILLFSGLIEEAADQYELAAVISHELAHVELGHVMKKLTKEVGISFLLSMTTGGGSSDMARESLKVLTSTAYDRNLEREADMVAAEYLISADINPLSLASFLERMSEKESDTMRYFTWISTHPDLGERVERIKIASEPFESDNESLVSDADWQMLKERIIN